MAGAGVASTTASARAASPADHTDQASPARSSRSAASREPHVDLPLPQARRERPHQRGHAALERPEQGRARRVRRRDLGPECPHEAAAALRGGQQRREGRRGGHVVDRAGVDAPEERIDQDIDDLLAQLARHQGPDGAVADRAPDVGAGQHGIAGQAEHASRAEDPGAGGRPEPGGDPERVPLGQRAQASPGPHRCAAGRDRHQGVGEPQLCAQVDRLGAAPQEPVGARVDGPSRDDVAAQGAAEVWRRLEQHDRRGVGAALGTARQLPGRGQAADAATDDDHPPRRHVSWRRRRRRSRRPGQR